MVAETIYFAPPTQQAASSSTSISTACILSAISAASSGARNPSDDLIKASCLNGLGAGTPKLSRAYLRRPLAELAEAEEVVAMFALTRRHSSRM
jgi:hypothetical protein